MNKKIKLHYFAPHPAQYHLGIYKELSKFDNLDFRIMKMMIDVNMKNFGLNPSERYVTLRGEATFNGNRDKTF